ncbi:MAG: tRNA epoxyqueuosine(34) reductase QueG [Clostridiales bacterium]|jgi:epoxyqueuosine reductase|nr:tRNA epoxyqueuosine(34) reductase QueG [Clostridiales bacterium]
MNLKNEIEKFAELNGCIAGICRADKFDGGVFEMLQNTVTPFVKYSAEQRTNPKLAMENAESIIVAGLSYNKKVPSYAGEFSAEALPGSVLRGKFSLSACGADYHITVKALLLNLARHLSRFTTFDYKIFVDTGPLIEREILYRCGLCWRGKNFSAVSNDIGSMFNCGYMLTNLKFGFPETAQNPQTSEINSRCGNCRLCVKACPTGALTENSFNYEKCVSYLTQKKGSLTEKEESLLGVNLYGCDICQLVCPYNKGKETGEVTDADEIYPRLRDILALTKKEFTEKYSQSVFYYKGLGILKRNAEIALRNLNKSETP